MILSEQQPPEYPLKTWWNNCFDYYHWNVFEYFTEASSYYTDLGWIDRSLYVIISISCTIFMSSSHITAIHSAFVHYFSFLPNTYTHTHTHTHTHTQRRLGQNRQMHACRAGSHLIWWEINHTTVESVGLASSLSSSTDSPCGIFCIWDTWITKFIL